MVRPNCRSVTSRRYPLTNPASPGQCIDSDATVWGTGSDLLSIDLRRPITGSSTMSRLRRCSRPAPRRGAASSRSPITIFPTSTPPSRSSRAAPPAISERSRRRRSTPPAAARARSPGASAPRIRCCTISTTPQTQTYTITIDDGHGDVTSQLETVTLNPGDAAPVISPASQSGLVAAGTVSALDRPQSGAERQLQNRASPDWVTGRGPNGQVSTTPAYQHSGLLGDLNRADVSNVTLTQSIANTVVGVSYASFSSGSVPRGLNRRRPGCTLERYGLGAERTVRGHLRIRRVSIL